MQVSFYNYNKRINSTARPIGSGTAIDCIIKDGSSQLAPTIRIKWSSGAAPVYNYAYISAFGGRYYFIADWTFEDRQWTAKLSVDVLATYKTNIGGLTKYVTRSASKKGAAIMETLYPAKSTYTQTRTNLGTGFTEFANGGTYVMTVINDRQISLSANQPPLLYQGPAAAVQQAIYNTTNAMEGAAEDMESVARESSIQVIISKLFYIPGRFFSNLGQFIRNVMWFPISFTTVEDAGMYIGRYEATRAMYRISSPIWRSPAINFDVRNYPPAGKDAWEYMAPYAAYTIEFQPFGIIPIPSEDVINADYIRLYVTVDALSGLGILQVVIDDGTPANTRTIATVTAQVGVSFPFGASTPDYGAGIRAAASAMAVLSSSGASAAQMTLATEAAIGTAAQGLGENGFVTGSTSGGAASISANCHFQARIYDHADIDPEEEGYPLCEMTQIDTLSGYVKVTDGDITSLTATDSELMQVKSYLEGGFFYE